MEQHGEKINWHLASNTHSHDYECGYCGKSLVSNKGYWGNQNISGLTHHIYICHFCHKPTYFDVTNNKQYPGTAFGDSVDNINDAPVQKLYEEARNCISVNAFTSAAMACRKILMNIAVSKGAKENLRFTDYVEFLSDNNFIPPDGKDWVKYIKNKGNDANHKIEIVSKKDAKDLMYFTKMLLTFVYAVPARYKQSTKQYSKTVKKNPQQSK